MVCFVLLISFAYPFVLLEQTFYSPSDKSGPLCIDVHPMVCQLKKHKLTSICAAQPMQQSCFYFEKLDMFIIYVWAHMLAYVHASQDSLGEDQLWLVMGLIYCWQCKQSSDSDKTEIE